MVPTVTKCGLELWGGLLCLCRGTTAILEQFQTARKEIAFLA